MDGDQGGSATAQIAGGAIGATATLNQPVPRRVAIQERASLLRGKILGGSHTGCVFVVGAAEFPLVLMDLLSNEGERIALGRRGAETLRSQMGATEKTLRALEQLLEASSERVGAGL